jgi:hypothetical protein
MFQTQNLASFFCSTTSLFPKPAYLLPSGSRLPGFPSKQTLPKRRRGVLPFYLRPGILSIFQYVYIQKRSFVKRNLCFPPCPESMIIVSSYNPKLESNRRFRLLIFLAFLKLGCLTAFFDSFDNLMESILFCPF